MQYLRQNLKRILQGPNYTKKKYSSFIWNSSFPGCPVHISATSGNPLGTHHYGQLSRASSDWLTPKLYQLFYIMHTTPENNIATQIILPISSFVLYFWMFIKYNHQLKETRWSCLPWDSLHHPVPRGQSLQGQRQTNNLLYNTGTVLPTGACKISPQ